MNNKWAKGYKLEFEMKGFKRQSIAIRTKKNKGLHKVVECRGLSIGQSSCCSAFNKILRIVIANADF